MVDRYIMTDDEGTFETEVVHTPDGTFTRNRFKGYVDKKTGLPVYGRWSPWFSEASAKYTPERTFLAS